ncbi:MAG: glycosyltransferase family 4 protein [Sedimentisphaerales bacterium]|jgi:glycosyltransferase involved in cell wall biosynthesis|nr:glycosyltransferase family 4 protein [Sedimentisphaerales bacterium]NLT78446.1 glycosyltransferase family 4 protein [Planctomycetota bacterium]
MKLLMLNYEFPPIGGGGGQAHRSLLKEFAGRRDLVVDVLTSAPKPGFSTESFADNIRIHKVGIRKGQLHLWRRTEVLAWLLKARSHYRRLLRETTYDLVHAFFAFPTGWLCYRTAGQLPYVISLRGSDVPGGNARLQWDYKVLGPLVFKPIWQQASALVACSEGLRQRALRFLPSAQIDVIPNGVDLDRFAPGEEPLGTPRPLRLITVGRLSTTKRLDMLIEAVERLGAAGDSVQLTIVGGGALENELRGRISAERFRGMVTMTGRQDADRMPELYRTHDVYVSASAQEGMSNAMLEAMASGLPIVTTRCEGVDELIADNGLVVDEASPKALARAIAAFVNDRPTLRAMSTAARRQAERFTWRSVAERYLELYERIVTQRGVNR